MRPSKLAYCLQMVDPSSTIRLSNSITRTNPSKTVLKSPLVLRYKPISNNSSLNSNNKDNSHSKIKTKEVLMAATTIINYSQNSSNNSESSLRFRSQSRKLYSSIHSLNGSRRKKFVMPSPSEPKLVPLRPVTMIRTPDSSSNKRLDSLIKSH